MKRWNLRLDIIALVLMLGVSGILGKPPQNKSAPIMLVVMDPLSKELACACVEGYAQRDYRKLAARLKSDLKQPVSIEFSDDLADTLAGQPPEQEVVVIGERSLVAHGAKKAKLKCRPVCELTDLDGSTTLTASFVARSDDGAAKELKDVNGRKVFFGLADADEKQAAALASLRAAGVALPTELEKRASYTDAALDLLDSSLSPPPIAVIPTYALALLEGCGSVKPGNLKVVAKTPAAPFIAVFLADIIPAEKQETILKSLLSIKHDAKLLKDMESRDGFKPLSVQESPATKASAARDWPDWRGPDRDGHVPKLPTRLPASAKFVWKKAAMPGSLAGLSVSGQRLILAERDFGDEHDVYRCLDTDTGELLWRLEFPARGDLDYGRSPRATPVIHADKAFLLGAFGDLRCVNLTNGKMIWQRELPREFQAELPTWGMCATPLVVDDLLIVNPGGTNASLVALDCATGQTRWTTPGLPAAYASFICGNFGGRRQIVGYDQNSLGGWDVKTGQRLWQLVPPTDGDFNVPTPIAVEGGIIVSTENNGTRFYRFDDSGCIIPQPAGTFADLSPDTVTPVVTNGRVFGAYQGLRCLELRKALQPVWHREDDTLGDYVSLIADNERVLVISLHGELVLLDGKADDCSIISRLRIFDNDVEIYSHPALVGTRLYARGGSSVVCVDLATD